MKIVPAIRNEIAYDLVKTQLAVTRKLSNVHVSENVLDLKMLEDFTKYYEADLYLIDKATTHSAEMISLLENVGTPFLLLEDLKNVDIKIFEALNIEELEEVKETIKIPQKEVIEKEIIVKKIEKEIIVEVYRAIPPVTILIGSTYSCAGSSTIATNLARMIADRGIDVTYIENPLAEPRMYDTLQVEYSEQPFEDLAQVIVQGEMPKGKVFRSNNVNWIVNDPNKLRITEFSYEQFNLLLSFAKTTVTIIDVSNSLKNKAVQNLMKITDGNYIVLEANPVKNDHQLLDGEGLFGQIDEIPYQLIVTKTEIKGIDMKVIRENLSKRPFIELPYIPYEELIKALFELNFYYDTSKGELFFEKHFRKLISVHLPSNFVNKNKEKLGKRFLGWIDKL